MHPFTKVVEVRWSDIDANQHMRHNAYADLCTHTRMEWLAAAGFGMDAFMAHGFGPVLFRESTEYRREVHLGERITVDVQVAAASPDNSRWKIRQQLIKPDGKLAAIYEVAGAWMDLRERKLIPPPAALAAILADLPRCADFELLPQPEHK